MFTNIRAVRKARGLTLSEVAARCKPPTTAQTIGRLETGLRTVSVDWLNRIAAALEVDARQLVEMEGQSSLPLTALVTAKGVQAPTRTGQVMPPVPAAGWSALRVQTSIGDFRTGDELWIEHCPPDQLARAVNTDVLVPEAGGRFQFGRLMEVGPAGVVLLPAGAGSPPQAVALPAWFGRVRLLVRAFG